MLVTLMLQDPLGRVLSATLSRQIMVAPVGNLRSPFQRFEGFMLIPLVERRFNTRVYSKQQCTEIGEAGL